jgi:hypothetical protein
MWPDRRDRSTKRIELRQPAMLITMDGHTVHVILKDVSLDGFTDHYPFFCTVAGISRADK